MTIDQQFNIINDKLQQLLRQHARLKKENEQLKEMLQEQKEQQTLSLQVINQLEQQITILKYAAGEMNEKDKKDFEKKINQYIKEIDKCIAFLGQ
jgi:cell division septum initiation protein DivIVA